MWPECDVQLDEPSISRRHARIDIGPRLLVTDLESANGTTVERRRLDPGETVELSLGELLTTFVQRFNASGPPSNRSAEVS